jgi:hypothetical protein
MATSSLGWWLAGAFCLLLLAALRWLLGDALSANWLLSQAVFAASLSTIALVPKRWLWVLLWLVFFSLLGAGSTEAFLGTRSWLPDLPGLVRRVGSAEWIKGREEPRSAYRAWRLPEATTINVSLGVRTDEESRWDWAWLTSDERVTVEPLLQEGARLHFASQSDPYAFVRYALEPPASFQELIAQLSLKSETPVCGAIFIVVSGDILTSEEVCVAEVWREVKFFIAANELQRSSQLDVVLNDFDGQRIEVKGPALFLQGQDVTIPLGPPTPRGVLLQLENAAGEVLARSRVLPTETWQPLTLTANRANEGVFRLVIGAEPRASVTTKNLEVSGNTAAPMPWRPPYRHSFFLPHPNLAGHTLVVLALLLCSWQWTMLPLRRAWCVGLFLLLLAAVAVWFTGSRGALTILLLGVPLLWLVDYRPRSRLERLASVIVIVLLLAVAVVAGVVGFRQRVVSEGASRLEIWSEVLQNLSREPWTGVGQQVLEVSGFAVAHAHNVWLQFALSYGLPGLFIALAFTTCLVIAATRRGLESLIFLLLVFALNTIDYTLFFSGVFVPLAVAVLASPTKKGLRPYDRQQ